VLTNKVNSYELYQNNSIVAQKKLAQEGNAFAKAYITPERNIYYVFRNDNLMLSGVSGDDAMKFANGGYASKLDFDFGKSIGATGIEVSQLKKYGVNNTADYQKAKSDFDGNKTLYGGNATVKNILVFLGDKAGANAQKITLTQFVDQRKAAEKKANERVLAEQQRRAKELEERRRNMKYTTLFVCTDRQGAGRDGGVAKQILSSVVSGDNMAAAHMINTLYAQFCTQSIEPFLNMKMFNDGATLYSTKGNFDYYLVKANNTTFAVVGK
jgi:hypothetical protein